MVLDPLVHCRCPDVRRLLRWMGDQHRLGSRVTFMVRRPKVKRYPDGVPRDVDRCGHEVDRAGVLFSDRCQRPRQRGSQFCWQHQV